MSSHIWQVSLWRKFVGYCTSHLAFTVISILPLNSPINIEDLMLSRISYILWISYWGWRLFCDFKAEHLISSTLCFSKEDGLIQYCILLNILSFVKSLTIYQEEALTYLYTKWQLDSSKDHINFSFLYKCINFHLHTVEDVQYRKY